MSKTAKRPTVLMPTVEEVAGHGASDGPAIAIHCDANDNCEFFDNG